MSVNKVILIGRLGQNPEVRYTPSGAAVVNLNLATQEAWADKSGQKQERTEWHRVVVWGKQAENCSQYLTKGRQVYIEGRLQTRQWQDKDGQTKYTTEIQAQTVQFLGTAAGSNAGVGPGLSSAPQGGAYGQSSEPYQASMNQQNTGSYSSQNVGFGAVAQGMGQNNSMGSNSGIPLEPSFTEDDIPF